MVAVTNTFNRGVLSPLSQGRYDVKQLRESSSVMDNFMPLRAGAMTSRSGFEDLGANASPISSTVALVPFVADINNTALIEFDSNGSVYFWVNDKRVSRTVPNFVPLIDPDLTPVVGVLSAAWSTPPVSSTSTVLANPSLPYVTLASFSPSDPAYIHQTVSAPVTSTQHYLTVILRADSTAVRITVGTGVGTGAYLDVTLTGGTYSLPVSFGGVAVITATAVNAGVGADVEFIGFQPSTTDFKLSHTPIESQTSLRWKQSNDVIYFTTNNGGQPFKISSFGNGGWGISNTNLRTMPKNGINTGAGAIEPRYDFGNPFSATVSSAPIFETLHFGRTLFLDFQGQQSTPLAINDALGGTTESVKISGSLAQRDIFYDIAYSGGAAGTTVTLQVSPDNVSWTDVATETTATTLKKFNDALNVTVLYYRLSVSAASYTVGEIFLTIYATGGSTQAVYKIVGVLNTTTVQIEVMKAAPVQVISNPANVGFGVVIPSPTRDWRWGAWSDDQGWPTALDFHQNRLWYARKDRVWGSVSDVYEDFTVDSLLGGSASVDRTVAFGLSGEALWLESGRQLILGTDSAEIAIRSDSLSSPITPMNCNLVPISTVGSSHVAPVKTDGRVFFVHRGGRAIHRSEYTYLSDSGESVDTTATNPDYIPLNVTSMAVTRFPETRVYAATGERGYVYLDDKTTGVTGWSEIGIALLGSIDHFVSLPTSGVNGGGEDAIYAIGTAPFTHTTRLVKLGDFNYRQRTALDFSKHVTYGSPQSFPAVTGLSHLEGVALACWGFESGDIQPKHLGFSIVSGGSLTVPSNSVFAVTVGIQVEARWVSNKLQAFDDEITLSKRKRVKNIAISALNTVLQSVRVGFMNADRQFRAGSLPTVDYPTNIQTVDEYDTGSMPVNDALRVNSKIGITTLFPATILSITYELDQITKKKRP